MHVSEPFIPEPSFFEFEVAVEKLNGYKSASTDQIQLELVRPGEVIRHVLRSTDLLFLFEIRTNSHSICGVIRWL
jgi:hypothetical protein